MANKLNVEKQVMFTGFVSNVEDYYRIANVFVFPSFREGLPVSVMEAMYCKLPVICSDIRGSKDLIFNNQGGYLVKPSDYNDLSNKINLLYNDEQLRKSMGIYNHKQVQKYSKENINNMMLKIYEKKTEI